MVRVQKDPNGCNYIVVTIRGMEEKFMWNDNESLMDAASLVSSVINSNCLEK